MNGFRKKKIKKSLYEQFSNWIHGHVILTLLLLVVGAFFLKGVYGAIISNDFTLKGIVISTVTEVVDRDAFGNTNMLLIGVGGEGHDGENLTDTMIVASIDHKDNTVAMLSIPRDIWVDNEVVGWGTRINGVYESIYDQNENHELAMGELQKEIENIVGLDIHYYAKVDFQGFEDIVDALGGVEIDVVEEIYDPYYPAKTGYGYDPFYIDAGLQTIDGETALQYARSRKTSSDFDRAARQQQLIGAIKEKALSAGVLLNPAKITKLLDAVSDNFVTDMSLDEMANLAANAEDFSTERIYSAVLNDAAYQMGGFLYTPDREIYGGAFVLVPYAGDWSEVQQFSKVFFYHPQILDEQVEIQVLNGTGTGGLAGLTKMFLTRMGFNITEYGNAAEKGVIATKIIPTIDPLTLESHTSETLQVLPSIIGGYTPDEYPLEYDASVWDTEAKIILELGEDFSDFYLENDDWFYVGVY